MTNNDYIKIRFDLLKKSYVGKELQKKTREVLHERLQQNEHEDEGILNDYMEYKNSLETMPEINPLATELQFEKNALGRFLFFNDATSTNRVTSNIHVALEEIPITQRGFYIKVEKGASKTDIEAATEYIQKHLIPTAEELLGFEYKRQKRNQTGADDDKKLQIYLKVEESIKEVMSEMKNNTYMEMDPEKGDFPIKIAIDYVAMAYVDDTDPEYKKKLSFHAEKIKNTYYDVITRYELPTIRKLTRLLKIFKTNSNHVTS